MRPLDPELEAEAWRRQREGIEATNAGRPAEGAESLRLGLSMLGWPEEPGRSIDGPRAAVVARLLISLAYAEAMLGKPNHGLELLEEASGLVLPADEGIRLQQRAAILRLVGRKSEALAVFALAEPLLERAGHIAILSLLLLNRSAVHGAEGKYPDALRDLRRCLEIARRHALHVDAAKALHARGIVERLIGDVPAALASLGEALSLYEEHAPGMVGMVLAQKASVLQDVGLVHEARTLLEQAIREMRRLQHHHTLARAEAHRSQLVMELGLFAEAISAATHAEAQAVEQGDLGVAGWAQLIRREAEFRTGVIGDSFARECVELADRRKEFGVTADSSLAMMLAARAMTVRGEFENARRSIAIGSPRGRAETLGVQLARRLAEAEIARAQEDRSRSLRHLRAGLSTLQDYRSRLGSVEFQVGTSSLGRELTELGLQIAIDSRRTSTVFSWSERVRAQAYRLPSVTPPEDPEVVDELAQLRKVRNAIREAELSGEPTAELLTRCRRIERSLRERSWRAGGPGESDPEARLSIVHSSLGDIDAAMVSFLSHRDELHALILAGGKTTHFKLGSISAIDEGARRLFADLDGFQGRKMPARMADAIRNAIHHQTERLATALLSKVMPLIGDRDLVIVPTQLLSSLPWGLLPPLRGRPVTVAPSASVWMAAGTREHKNGGKPLLVAGPDLALAESELTDIAHHYPQGTVLRGEHATAAATLAALDGAPIAHLAAHGHHEPDNVLFSRLDLADGPLMAYDIARLAAPPRHVTLSACDVGRSVVAVGDETLGFTAALLYAGTSTVVSSVARVAHDVAAAVMVDYHEAIAAGVPPARALAEANAKHELAPFVLFGAG